MAARAPESIKPLLIDTAELSAGTALYLSTERANYLGGRFVDATWDLEELEGMKDKIVQEDLFKTRITGI
ncbi:MAG: hypothetical protein M1830_000038 [Pleopsidium flavum]|nr:MAG: hypothetical protein M1830_000038 [Pleopsidium flavum]